MLNGCVTGVLAADFRDGHDLAMARHPRRRPDGRARTGNLLVCAAIAADVSDNPVASQTRRLFLARTGRRMRADYLLYVGMTPVLARLRCKPMKQLFIYGAAALAEIGGCFAFWAWLRMDKSPIWLIPGMLSLALFAWLLT